MCTFLQTPTIYERLNFSVDKFCCVGVQRCSDRPRVCEGSPYLQLSEFFFLNGRLYPRGHYRQRQRDGRTGFDTRCTSGTKENYSSYPMPLCW